MNRQERRLAARVAARPPARTVTVSGTGEFADWTATARADFPAGWLADLDSGNASRVLDVLERIIVEHNLPDDNDELAESVRDVSPYDGLMNIGTAIGQAIGRLPNR